MWEREPNKFIQTTTTRFIEYIRMRCCWKIFKSLHTISSSHTAAHNLVDSFNLLILKFIFNSSRLIDNCCGCTNWFFFWNSTEWAIAYLKVNLCNLKTLRNILLFLWSLTHFFSLSYFLLQHHAGALDDDYYKMRSQKKELFLWLECLTWHFFTLDFHLTFSSLQVIH